MVVFVFVVFFFFVFVFPCFPLFSLDFAVFYFSSVNRYPFSPPIIAFSYFVFIPCLFSLFFMYHAFLLPHWMNTFWFCSSASFIFLQFTRFWFIVSITSSMYPSFFISCGKSSSPVSSSIFIMFERCSVTSCLWFFWVFMCCSRFSGFWIVRLFFVFYF